MVIPKTFGVGPDERMDMTVRSMEEIVTISQRVQAFCSEKGIEVAEGDDAGSNIGIRMIFSILKDIEYQSILGMNVLTMKI